MSEQQRGTMRDTAEVVTAEVVTAAGEPGSRSHPARGPLGMLVAVLVLAALVAGCRPQGGPPPQPTPTPTTTTTTTAAGPSAPGAGAPVNPPSPGATSGATSTPATSSAPDGEPGSSTSPGVPPVAGPDAPSSGCALSITLSDSRQGPRRITIETLTFTNTGDAPCALGGQGPARSTTAQFVGQDGDVGAPAYGDGGDLQLAPGEATETTLTTRSIFGFDDERCEPAAVGGVRISPPAAAAPVVLPAQLGVVCTAQAFGSFLEVGPLSSRG